MWPLSSFKLRNVIDVTAETRTYYELNSLESYEERFEYLKLSGSVGRSTFGHERYLNQRFYASREWKLVRQKVLARDLGRDLGVEGYEIFDKAIVHHMNPMAPHEIKHSFDDILNPKYLISVAPNTHNAIHYGDSSLLSLPRERRPGDTKLWGL